MRTEWDKAKSYFGDTRLRQSKLSKLKKQQHRHNRRKSKIVVNSGGDFQDQKTSVDNVW